MEFYLNTSNGLKMRPAYYGYEEDSISENMNVETFKRFTNIMLLDGDDRISISGVEPFLNPEIDKILEECTEKTFMFGWKTDIWTALIGIENYYNCITPSMKLCINIKSPYVLEDKFNDFCSNLEQLKSRGLIKAMENGDKSFATCFVCSLIEECNDYSFFWKLVDKYHIEDILLSVSPPKRKCSREEFFMSIKPAFMDFLEEAHKRNLFIRFECCNIPPCYFNGVEFSLISRVQANGTLALGWCPDYTQAMPDGTFRSCLFSSSKCSVKNIQELNTVGNYLGPERIKMIEDNYEQKCSNCLLQKERFCFDSCLCFGGQKNE